MYSWWSVRALIQSMEGLTRSIGIYYVLGLVLCNMEASQWTLEGVCGQVTLKRNFEHSSQHRSGQIVVA